MKGGGGGRPEPPWVFNVCFCVFITGPRFSNHEVQRKNIQMYESLSKYASLAGELPTFRNQEDSCREKVKITIVWILLCPRRLQTDFSRNG